MQKVFITYINNCNNSNFYFIQL